MDKRNTGRFWIYFFRFLLVTEIIIFSSFVFWQLFFRKISKESAQKGLEATSIPTFTPTTFPTPSSEFPLKKILYAKGLSENWGIYQMNSDGSEKKLLTIVSGFDYLPNADFLFLKIKFILLSSEKRGGVNKLIVDNLKTGKHKIIFSDSKDKNLEISNFVVSPDENKIAFDISSYDTDKKNYSFKIAIFDLETNTQKTLFSKILDPEKLCGWGNDFYLEPIYWTADGKRIFLKETCPMGFDPYLWITDLNGNYKKLPVIHISCSGAKISPDGSKIFFIDDNGEEVKWGCVGDIEPDMLKFYDVKTEEVKVIEDNTNIMFTVEKWYPDNKRVLYSMQKYISGGGCEANMSNSEYFIFDTEKWEKTQISPEEAEIQLKDYAPEKPKIEAVPDWDESCVGVEERRILINGNHIDDVHCGWSVRYISSF